MNTFIKSAFPAICLMTACLAFLSGCRSEQARLQHASQQQAKVPQGIPSPEELARFAVVVVIDKDGQISVQNTPLEEGADVGAAISKVRVKKKQNWPITILVDPSQKGALLLSTIQSAEKAGPGKVNVVTCEIDTANEVAGKSNK